MLYQIHQYTKDIIGEGIENLRHSSYSPPAALVPKLLFPSKGTELPRGIRPRRSRCATNFDAGDGGGSHGRHRREEQEEDFEREHFVWKMV